MDLQDFSGLVEYHRFGGFDSASNFRGLVWVSDEYDGIVFGQETWGFPSHSFIVVDFWEDIMFAGDLAVFVELSFKSVGYGLVFSESVDYGYGFQ